MGETTVERRKAAAAPPEAPAQAVDVSFVLPCLNEAAALPGCLERAFEALRELEAAHGLRGEVLVADNGSTDGSREVARALGARVVEVPVRGYGAALIGGMRAAAGRYLVMGDSDGSYDFLEAVPMVEALIRGADICMGSRFKGTILPGAMPWKNRYIGNPVLTGILRLLYNSRVSDAHCGLRALTKESFDRMALNAGGMEFASEMVLKAALLKLRVEEVPVTLSPDPEGRMPHLRPWRDGWRHLRYMLMLSPVWLFLAPALVFGLGATVIFVALLSHPGEESVRLGGLRFGDHWMIMAGGMMAAAHQMVLFGGAALIYGIRAGYRRPGPVMTHILKWARLEHLLLLSAAFAIGALAFFGRVIWSWSETRFTELDELRSMVSAATLGLLGVQSFFGGFLISIVAGNEARFPLSGTPDGT
ncbi:MAG: glycosyltransferase family 2 protein [Alphaproteobacteria bacterium]